MSGRPAGSRPSFNSFNSSGYNYRNQRRGGQQGPQINMNFNSGSGSNRRQPPSRQNSGQGQYTGYNYTDEDKAEIKRLKIEVFNRAIKLCVLPGGIPMCYSVGYCLITDKRAWDNYFKYDCKRYAKRLFHIRRNPNEGEDAAPFTWGLRPISATKLVTTYGDEAAAWVWDFITSNITPYPDARELFFNAVRSVPVSDQWTQASKDDLLHAITPNHQNFEKTPDRQTMVEFLGLVDSVECSPTELQADYLSEHPHFANLMELQNGDALRNRRARLDQQIARISQAQSEAEDQAAAVDPVQAPAGDVVQDFFS